MLSLEVLACHLRHNFGLMCTGRLFMLPQAGNRGEQRSTVTKRSTERFMFTTHIVTVTSASHQRDAGLCTRLEF